MKDVIFDNFQESVDHSLLRHRSILDILTKYSESNARVNRAIAKSVTNCGCIKINASKQRMSEDDSIDNLCNCLNSHIEGITVDGIKYNLARLQELGLLKRVGSKRYGYWVVLGE